MVSEEILETIIVENCLKWQKRDPPKKNPPLADGSGRNHLAPLPTFFPPIMKRPHLVATQKSKTHPHTQQRDLTQAGEIGLKEKKNGVSRDREKRLKGR